MKKILFFVCIALILSMILPLVALAAPEDGPTDVTEKFVDESFRGKVLETIGKEKGERIYSTDVSGIKNLYIHSKQITDLSGIECFESLEKLDVGYCSLTTLDVSSLKNLKMLNCYENKIIELEICGLSELTGIVCYNNYELMTLKLSDLPSLIFLSCSGTGITSLDLSGTPSLEELSCNRTNIRELDISECPNMRMISADFADKWMIKGYTETIEYNPSCSVESGQQGGTDLPFRDVKKSDWFFGNVEYMYTNNLMNGTSADRFEPKGTMTRAMAATIIYRFIKNRYHFTKEAEERFITDEYYKTNFMDVPQRSWYTAAVNYLTYWNVIKGKTKKTFAPGDNVTRAEFAVLLHRFAEAYNCYIEISPDRGLPADFKSVPSFAREAVEEMYKAGVLMGRPGNNVDPNAFVTRAEAAAMYERCAAAMRDKVEPEPILVP